MVDYHERMLELQEQIADALGGGGIGIKIEDGTVEGRLLKVNADGSIDVRADLEASEIEIGKVVIKDDDNANTIAVDGDGQQTVKIDSSVDPATESKQDDILSKLDTPRQEDGHGSQDSNPSYVEVVEQEMVKTENSIILNDNDTALTAIMQDILTNGSNYRHYILRNHESPGGGNIFYNFDGAGSEGKLLPGQSITLDWILLTKIQMRGASGGEDYEIVAWG